MLNFNLVLQTDNVLLRPLQSQDLDYFYPLANDASMWKYFTSDLSDKDELKKWVNTALEDIVNKRRLAFTVIDRRSGTIAGSTSFGNISARDKRIEIGWTWLGKNFQNKGLNKQMKYLMLKYCFENIGFERVECKTDVLNIPARKALSNIGMKEEGILRSHTLMTHNRRRDTIYYSVLLPEWEDVKKLNNWE